MPVVLEPLDVIRIRDELIKPPGPKMVVCIWPAAGLFYRINSYDDYPIGIFLPLKPNHPFLEWDSYLEVGRIPIQLDDFTIGKAVHSCGGAPLGKIHHGHIDEICKAIQEQDTLPARLVKAMVSTLQTAVPKSDLSTKKSSDSTAVE